MIEIKILTRIFQIEIKLKVLLWLHATAPPPPLILSTGKLQKKIATDLGKIDWVARI